MSIGKSRDEAYSRLIETLSLGPNYDEDPGSIEFDDLLFTTAANEIQRMRSLLPDASLAADLEEASDMLLATYRFFQERGPSLHIIPNKLVPELAARLRAHREKLRGTTDA